MAFPLSSRILMDIDLLTVLYQTEGETRVWTFWRATCKLLEDEPCWSEIQINWMFSGQREVGYEQCSVGHVHCSKVWEHGCWYDRSCSGDFFVHKLMSVFVYSMLHLVHHHVKHINFSCRVDWLDFSGELRSLTHPKGSKFQHMFIGGYVK